jgi:hypothetical protein
MPGSNRADRILEQSLAPVRESRGSNLSLKDELQEHLSKFATAPFLFVGSGMSRRYIQSATWAGLLSRFADDMGKPYARYSSAANGNYPAIATALAADFHGHWFDSEKYELSRIVHPEPESKSSPLKIEIANYVEGLMRNLPTSGPEFQELEELKKAVIQGVITTNYDPLLEYVFPTLKVYVGQEDLLFSDPQGVGEIYKIHGSYTHPDSLVLTEKDYKDFGDRNAYLAAKLLTVFVEHPVIFLGYSLTDENVREVLFSIAKILTKDNISKLQDRLIFVQWDENALSPRMSRTIIPMESLSLPILEITVASYEDIFAALSGLKERIPLRLLRKIKEQITELVLTSDPKDKTYVMSIDDAVDAADVDVVIGVGLHRKLDLQGQGIVGQNRYDLLRDVIIPRLPHDQVEPMRLVVSSVLPNHLTGRVNTPMYKYLRASGYLNPDGTLNTDDVPARVKLRVKRGMSFFESQYRRESDQIKAQADRITDFPSFLKASSWNDVARVLPYLDRSLINMSVLHEALRHEIESTGHVMYTAIAKVICIYDLLVHQKEQTS